MNLNVAVLPMSKLLLSTWHGHRMLLFVITVYIMIKCDWFITCLLFCTNALYNKHGKNIELTQNNTVATRVRGYDYCIVCTSEPVSIGQMFKVTVLERDTSWGDGGLVSLQ